MGIEVKIVDQKNFFTGLFYLLFGLAVAWGASTYRIGTSTRMGAGFFPLVVAIGLAITGLVLLITSMRGHAESTKLENWSLRTVFTVLAAVCLFGVLIEPTGLVVTVPVLLIGAALAHPPVAWRNVAISVALLMPMTWLIFVKLLGLQLRLLPAFFYQ